MKTNININIRAREVYAKGLRFAQAYAAKREQLKANCLNNKSALMLGGSDTSNINN